MWIEQHDEVCKNPHMISILTEFTGLGCNDQSLLSKWQHRAKGAVGWHKEKQEKQHRIFFDEDFTSKAVMEHAKYEWENNFRREKSSHAYFSLQEKNILEGQKKQGIWEPTSCSTGFA